MRINTTLLAACAAALIVPAASQAATLGTVKVVVKQGGKSLSLSRKLTLKR